MRHVSVTQLPSGYVHPKNRPFAQLQPVDSRLALGFWGWIPWVFHIIHSFFHRQGLSLHNFLPVYISVFDTARRFSHFFRLRDFHNTSFSVGKNRSWQGIFHRKKRSRLFLRIHKTGTPEELLQISEIFLKKGLILWKTGVIMFIRMNKFGA